MKNTDSSSRPHIDPSAVRTERKVEDQNVPEALEAVVFERFATREAHPVVVALPHGALGILDSEKSGGFVGDHENHRVPPFQMGECLVHRNRRGTGPGERRRETRVRAEHARGCAKQTNKRPQRPPCTTLRGCFDLNATATNPASAEGTVRHAKRHVRIRGD
jgi:hypothetical protein